MANILIRNAEIKLQEQITETKSDPTYKRIVENFALIARSQDLYIMYNTEKLFIEEEMNKSSILKTKDSSLTNTFKQIIQAKPALDLIQNKELYKSGLDFFTDKSKDSKGLPYDGVRLYIKSQTARLINLAKGVETKEQGELIKARSGCLNAFKKAYIARQAQVLDIDLKPSPKDVSEAESKPTESKPKKRRRMT